MNFIVNNEEHFKTNSSVHVIITRDKHWLYWQKANFLCSQKSTFYASSRIFTSLPCGLIDLKKEKAQFKEALTET